MGVGVVTLLAFSALAADAPAERLGQTMGAAEQRLGESSVTPEVRCSSAHSRLPRPCRWGWVGWATVLTAAAVVVVATAARRTARPHHTRKCLVLARTGRSKCPVPSGAEGPLPPRPSCGLVSTSTLGLGRLRGGTSPGSCSGQRRFCLRSEVVSDGVADCGGPGRDHAEALDAVPGDRVRTGLDQLHVQPARPFQFLGDGLSTVSCR